jgi:acetyl esterase/lipase
MVMMRYMLSGAIFVVALSGARAGEAAKAVELRGILRTGIVAIGGETTGTIIQTDKGSFELDLGSGKELRAKAERLAGKTVVVKGTLTIRKGVEIRERRIVTVRVLEPVEAAKQPKADGRPAPTVANLAYDSHERQVLDFWQARSDQPTPLVLYIHGGGWQNGDKSSLSGTAIRRFLEAGISVAAINYRYVKQAAAAGIKPPVKAPLEDAARALQFIRSKAKEWNIDKNRVGATGGSAGGCSSLWLAFHPDLTDPKSDDPVARESSRLYCAAVNGPQTSLDPRELREWMPNYGYGAHAFGFSSFQAFYDGREKVLEWIKEYSPIEHVTRHSPPIFMEFPSQTVPPVVGERQKDPTHSAVLGLKLAEKLRAVNVEVIVTYPGHTNQHYRSSADFLIDRLRK